MASATLNLRVSPRRMLSPKAATDYCGGVPCKLIPVAPVEVMPGRLRYDLRDLDDYIDGLKAGRSDGDDDILGRLG